MSSSTAPVEVRASDEGRERIRVALGLMLFVGLQLIAHYAALASAGGGVSVVAPLLLPGAIAAWAGFRSSARAGLCALLVLAVLAAACLVSPVAAHLLPLICQLLITLALTWLFGAAPNSVAEPENSFAFEITWAWTSSPITTSQSPVSPWMYDIVPLFDVHGTGDRLDPIRPGERYS